MWMELDFGVGLLRCFLPGHSLIENMYEMIRLPFSSSLRNFCLSFSLSDSTIAKV